MICKQCGLEKPMIRFFYHSRYKRYSYICKACEIKNGIVNRNRNEIRGLKDISKIKQEINIDDSYMKNGIDYLAEILAMNIIQHRIRHRKIQEIME